MSMVPAFTVALTQATTELSYLAEHKIVFYFFYFSGFILSCWLKSLVYFTPSDPCFMRQNDNLNIKHELRWEVGVVTLVCWTHPP